MGRGGSTRELRLVTATYKVLEKRRGIAKPKLRIDSHLCRLIILGARVIIRDILKGKKKSSKVKIIGRFTSPRSSIGENEIFNYTNRKTKMDCPKYIPVGSGRLVVCAPGHRVILSDPQTAFTKATDPT